MSMLSRPDRAQLLELRDRAAKAHRVIWECENAAFDILNIGPTRGEMELRQYVTDFLGLHMMLPEFVRKVRTEQARRASDGESR